MSKERQGLLSVKPIWSNYQPKPKITVTNGKNYEGSLKDGTARLKQTKSYNTQPTYKPKKTTYNPQVTYKPKKTTYNPQATVSPVATQKQVQEAARKAKIRADKIRLQKKEALRKKTQAKFDKTEANIQNRLQVRPIAQQPTIQTPKYDRTPYDEARIRAFNQANQVFENKRDGDRGFFSNIWRDLSNDPRNYAEDQMQEMYGDQFGEYETKIQSFLSEQAKRHAAVQRFRLFSDQSKYQKAMQEFADWEEAQINELESLRGAYEGKHTALEQAAGSKVNNPIGKIGQYAKKYITDPSRTALSFAGRYLIGEGDENFPSMVTAPSRIANWLGNLNTKDRDIHKYGGETFNRDGSDKNAWQATFNQRNLNLRPWQSQPRPTEQNWQQYQEMGLNPNTQIGISPNSQNYQQNQWMHDKNQSDYEMTDLKHRAANTALEHIVDPLNLAGGIGKSAKIGNLSKAFKLSKPFKKARKTLDNIANTKAVKWLNSEHKTLADRRNDFVMNQLDDIYKKSPESRKHLQAWTENKSNIKRQQREQSLQDANKLIEENLNVGRSKLTGGKSRLLWNIKRDTLVTELQKYIRGGDDVLRQSKKLNDNEKQAIKELAAKLDVTFTDYLKKEHGHILNNDRTSLTPYQARRNYIPQYDRGFSPLRRKSIKHQQRDDGWWFTKEQKKQKTQSHNQLVKSLAAREYGHKLSTMDMPHLRELYKNNESISDNIAKIEGVNNYVQPTKFERLTAPAKKTMSAWKTSVLTMNPAWYVNNEAFNLQRGLQAGGFDFLKNQIGTKKYFNEHLKPNIKNRLKPSEAQKKLSDIATDVNTDLPTNKLSKLATNQENRSRIALYRTFRQKGMTHDQAIKQLDKSLFRYKTKNWERPLKAVMPFWAWDKNLTKAAATMTKDHPLWAQGYNEFAKFQSNQFSTEFDTVVAPELEKQGYTPEEIAKIKSDQSKYYDGRLKIGDKYYNTPWHGFSRDSLEGLSTNPFIAALAETSTATGSYGEDISGRETSPLRRLTTKFPQVELGRKYFNSKTQDLEKATTKRWIGDKGSAGYGLGKESQGHDPSKPNYKPSQDPTRKINDDFMALLGKPRGLEFDTDKTIEFHKLRKVTDKYFDLDRELPFNKSEAAKRWGKDEYNQAIAKQKEWGYDYPSYDKWLEKQWDRNRYDMNKAREQEIFKQYGMTADDFYKGVLGKYDTNTTKGIKELKEQAAHKNDLLFKELDAQPAGTKSEWSLNKLKELVDQGYFDENPFLQTFSWLTPESIAKGEAGRQKKRDYDYAKSTGDWSKWEAKYGKSEKKIAWEKAKLTGDWSAYNAKYGLTEKAKLYRAAKQSGDWSKWESKYGKSDRTLAIERALESGDWSDYIKKFKPDKFDRAKIEEAKFWKRYAESSKEQRRQLLADNPIYNRRKDWTQDQWDDWKADKKAKEVKSLASHKDGAKIMARYQKQNQFKSDQFKRKQAFSRTGKRIVWRV